VAWASFRETSVDPLAFRKFPAPNTQHRFRFLELNVEVVQRLGKAIHPDKSTCYSPWRAPPVFFFFFWSAKDVCFQPWVQVLGHILFVVIFFATVSAGGVFVLSCSKLFCLFTCRGYNVFADATFTPRLWSLCTWISMGGFFGDCDLPVVPINCPRCWKWTWIRGGWSEICSCAWPKTMCRRCFLASFAACDLLKLMIYWSICFTIIVQVWRSNYRWHTSRVQDIVRIFAPDLIDGVVPVIP
jgi:hypothetical protein